MIWIESHQELREHPKLYNLVDKLGVSKPEAIGYLHLLWWWCVDYAETGSLNHVNASQIARASCYAGDAKAYVDALIECGFIDFDGENMCVHDWLEYCGTLIHKRLERKTKREENGKKSQTKVAESQTIIPVRQKKSDKSCRTAENNCLPNRTEPNRTVPNQTEPNSTEQNQTKIKSGGTRAKSVRPSLEEVKQLFSEREYPIQEAEKFFTYYESNGWRVGKNPMRSWQACASNWETRRKEFIRNRSPIDSEELEKRLSIEKMEAFRKEKYGT